MRDIAHTYAGANSLRYAENLGLITKSDFSAHSAAGAAFTIVSSIIKEINTCNARNKIGEEFDVGCVLTNDESINAHVYFPKGGNHLIAIDNGLYLSFQEIACAILTLPDVSKTLGFSTSKGDPSFFCKAPLGLLWKNFDDINEYVYGRNNAVVFDKESTSIIKMLVTLMLLYVIYHELGHAIFGHKGIDVIGKYISINESEMSGDLNGNRNPGKQIAEIQADDFAYYRLMSKENIDLSNSYFSYLLGKKNIETFCILAGTLVNSFWPWVDGSFKFNKDEILNVLDHPAGVIRATEFLAIACDLSWFAHTGNRRDKVPKDYTRDQAELAVCTPSLTKVETCLDFLKKEYASFFSFYPRTDEMLKICSEYNANVIDPARRKFHGQIVRHAFHTT